MNVHCTGLPTKNKTAETTERNVFSLFLTLTTSCYRKSLNILFTDYIQYIFVLQLGQLHLKSSKSSIKSNPLLVNHQVNLKVKDKVASYCFICLFLTNVKPIFIFNHYLLCNMNIFETCPVLLTNYWISNVHTKISFRVKKNQKGNLFGD